MVRSKTFFFQLFIIDDFSLAMCVSQPSPAALAPCIVDMFAATSKEGDESSRLLALVLSVRAWPSLRVGTSSCPAGASQSKLRDEPRAGVVSGAVAAIGASSGLGQLERGACPRHIGA